jgi:hypothetical protein
LGSSLSVGPPLGNPYIQEPPLQHSQFKIPMNDEQRKKIGHRQRKSWDLKKISTSRKTWHNHLRSVVPILTSFNSLVTHVWILNVLVMRWPNKCKMHHTELRSYSVVTFPQCCKQYLLLNCPVVNGHYNCCLLFFCMLYRSHHDSWTILSGIQIKPIFGF